MAFFRSSFFLPAGPAASNRGQSLVELLVAIGVGAILFVGSAAIVAPTLQINKTTGQVQIATGLGDELLNNILVFSQGSWSNISSLSTGCGVSYYLNTTSSPFTASVGTQSIQVSTTTYTRSFCLNNVYRTSSGNATTTGSGNTLDPSALQVVVTYNWTRGSTTTITSFITRNRTAVLDQTDWSGGPGFSGPATTTNAEFYASTNMNYSVPGSISGLITQTPYSNGYIYRRTITVSSTLVAPSGTTLSNFPMLVSGTYSYLAASSSGGNIQNGNGYDIIFTSDATGTIPLSYERESYSSSTGAVNFWVKVPTLSSSASDTIYMFYDSTSTITDQSNATGTWDSNYKAVWHLPNGTALSVTDSTGLASSTTNAGATATTGKIDGAAAFNGSSQYIDAPMTVNYSGITVEAWFNSSNLSGGGYNPRIVSNSHTDIDNKGFQLMFNDGGGSGFFDVGNGTTNTSATWTQTLSSGTWYQYIGTYDGTNARAYINGSLVATSVSGSGSIAASGVDVNIGRDGAYTSDYFTGTIDEVRISSIARSSDWIKTEYNNESSPSTFYALGSATTYTGPTTGTINTTTAQHYAWNDSLGWIDFYNSGNVGVTSSSLTGYASSSAGDISLDCHTSRNGNICSGGGRYSYYRSITVTSTGSVASGTNTNFPMLVSSTISSWEPTSDGGHIQNLCTAPNGGQEPCDLVFATSTANCNATTSLNFETESYTSSTGALVDWVNVPSLSAGSAIYACYGNSSVSTDQSHPSSTWNSNYVGVYHFPNGSTLSVNDSTGLGHNGTAENTPTAITGQVDGGMGIATNADVKVPANTDWNLGYGSYSFCSWVKFTNIVATNSYGFLFSNSSNAFGIAIHWSGSVYNFVGWAGGIYLTSASTLNTGTWYNLCETSDGATAKLFINGTQDTNTGIAATTGSGNDNYIGNFAGSYPIGSIDEFNVSKTALPSSWILTEYNNQSSPSTFYTIGSEQSIGVNYQVLNDGSGNLSGWAWNDAIGWISFCGGKSTTNCPGTTNYETTIDSGGNFQGWAWNDNVGWISFNCDNNSSCGTSNYSVVTTWIPPTGTTFISTLDSPTFDTGDTTGAQFNSILWQGTSAASSTVQFQLAASNSSSGPWTFTGPDGTGNTYYTPTAPGVSAPFNYYGATNNFTGEFFRYRVTITSGAGVSAKVNDVIVNWSP